MILLVKPVITRILVLRWTAVSKQRSVPQYLAKNRKAVKLVMDDTAVGSIVAAGDEWISQCADEVGVLQSSGALGDVLFSPHMKDLVNIALRKVVQAEIAGLVKKAVDAGTVCNQKVLEEWRSGMLTACEQQVKGLHLLASRRDATIDYRSSEISCVPVTCLTEYIELTIIACWKGAAIFSGGLQALDAEAMLGITASQSDKVLKIEQDFFSQAPFILQIFISICLKICISIFLFLFTILCPRLVKGGLSWVSSCRRRGRAAPTSFSRSSRPMPRSSKV